MVKTKHYFKFVETELDKDLSGKVIAITGTTTGTGYIAAKTVGSLGAEVILMNRKSSRVDKMLQQLKQEVPNGKFVAVECDLQDFSSVRGAATQIKNEYKELYCLCNNAGIMATPDEATVDGYDTQMQTNHLSHFLLTAELMPLLKAGAEKFGDARIVNHSSEARHMTVNKGLEEKYFQKNGGNLGGNELKLFAGPCFHRYHQTKLANSVFHYALHEKLQAKKSKIKAICAHPGGSATYLGDHMKFGFFSKMMIALLTTFVVQTPEDGTMGILKGMASPNAKAGVLYGPKGAAGKAIPNPPKPHETDDKAKEMLWRTSEEATGVKFVV